VGLLRWSAGVIVVVVAAHGRALVGARRFCGRWTLLVGVVRGRVVVFIWFRHVDFVGEGMRKVGMSGLTQAEDGSARRWRGFKAGQTTRLPETSKWCDSEE